MVNIYLATVGVWTRVSLWQIRSDVRGGQQDADH